MFVKKTLTAQTMMAIATMSFSGVAFSGIYLDADKNTVFAPDVTGNYYSEGDAYLEGHWWYDHNKTFEIGGSLLEVNAPKSEPAFEQYVENKATVKGDVKISDLRIGGQFQVGGRMELDKLTVEGQLSDLVGNFVTNQIIVNKGLYVKNNQELSLGNLVAKGEVVASGGGVLNILGGQIGQKDAAISRLDAENGSKVFVTGDVYAKDVHASTSDDLLNIDGTLYLSGSNSHGAGTVHVTNLIIESGGWHQINNLTVKVDQDMVLARGTLGIQSGTNLSIGNSLILKGDAFLQYQSTDKALALKKLVLAKDSIEQDGFQTYGAEVSIDAVDVNGAGRIDAYSVNSPELNPKISIKHLNISNNSKFALTNSRATNEDDSPLSKVTIESVALGDGAEFSNSVLKPKVENGETKWVWRGGANIEITSFKGTSGKIFNNHGLLSLGSDQKGAVIYSGNIEDKNNGMTLTLNQASSWTVQGKSNVGHIALEGGQADVSQTEDNLTVANLSGKGGTIILDVAKANTVVVAKTEEDTNVNVQASENADRVTISQAVDMVDRLEGVSNKTGSVDEGMYQGAISIDSKGHATQAQNSLISDTLELASASTLSLNRILMNDVRKRLGDIRSLEATNGVWARYDGGKLNGEGTTNTFNTLHIGGDMALFADNSLRLGVSASYTKGDVDYTRGSSDLDAYSLAAYGTWMADNGLFADVIARVAKAKSDMKVDGVYKDDLNNTAYSLSGEMGWRFNFNDMFYAEPQVEATYTYIDSDKMTLKGNGEAYHYAVDSIDSLIGRVGILAGMKCPAQKGDLYVRASMVHEFLGDATINGGNIAKLENDGKDTWVEYGVGANFNIMKNAYIWADIERTAGANVDEDWRGTVGVRYAF